MNQVFCSRLKKLRKEMKLTQADMGKAFNIQRATYGEYERGIFLPPYERIAALAEYFDVSVQYLMGDTDDPTPLAKSNPEVVDFADYVDGLLYQLKHNPKVVIGGEELDEDSRKLLIDSMESSLKMGKMISSMKKKGQ